MKKRMLSIVLMLSMLLSMAVLPANIFAAGEEADAELAEKMQLLKQIQIIHFYDWDGTYLGETLFWTIGGNAMADYAVTEFAQKNYAGEYNVDNSTHDDRYVDDASKPLTYKKGYNFGGWVEVSQDNMDDVFTSFESEDEINAAIRDIRKDGLDFNKGTACVKAAYVGNEGLNAGIESGAAVYYTYSDFTYDKLDSRSYSVEFTLKRENDAGQGVTRLKKPIIRLQFYFGEQNVLIPYLLHDKDEQRVKLNIPREFDYFTIAVMDNGYRNYLQTSPKSAIGAIYPNKECTLVRINGKGYVVEGTFTDVNNKLIEAIQKLEQGERLIVWTATNATIFDGMNLGTIMDNQDIGNSSETKRNTFAGVARNKIMLYSVANGKRKLTYEEMEQAILMDTGVHLESPSNANFVSYMKPKVDAVYEESQTNYGGAMTAQELEAYINANF